MKVDLRSAHNLAKYTQVNEKASRQIYLDPGPFVVDSRQSF
jgi:hypothetical protein